MKICCCSVVAPIDVLLAMRVRKSMGAIIVRSLVLIRAGLRRTNIQNKSKPAIAAMHGPQCFRLVTVRLYTVMPEVSLVDQ